MNDQPNPKWSRFPGNLAETIQFCDQGVLSLDPVFVDKLRVIEAEHPGEKCIFLGEGKIIVADIPKPEAPEVPAFKPYGIPALDDIH